MHAAEIILKSHAYMSMERKFHIFNNTQANLTNIASVFTRIILGTQKKALIFLKNYL